MKSRKRRFGNGAVPSMFLAVGLFSVSTGAVWTQSSELASTHIQAVFGFKSEAGQTQSNPTEIPENAKDIFVNVISEATETITASVRWIAENAEGFDPDTEVGHRNKTIRPGANRKISLMSRRGRYRLGRYRVDVLLGETVVHSIPFRIVSILPPSARLVEVGRPDGFNIALATLGGAVEVVDPDNNTQAVSEPEHWEVGNLIDGMSYAAKFRGVGITCDTCGWKRNRRDLPAELLFSFRDGRDARISAIVLDTRTIETEGNPDGVPKHIEVWVSSTGPYDGYSRVAGVRLRRAAEEQLLRFPVVSARYVKLRILSAHGTWSAGLSEVQIIEIPGQSTSIVDGLEKDIAHTDLGGAIVRFTSQVYPDGGAGMLIAGADEMSDWRSKDDHLPQLFVFSFHENREALVDRMLIRSPIGHDSDTWARRISVATSLTSPVSGFRQVGLMDLDMSSRDWTVPIERRARYVRLRILDNHGGPYSSLGRVSLIEGNEPGYRSVILPSLLDTGESSSNSTQLVLPETKQPEKEPNELPGQATVIRLGESFGGSIADSSDHDLYAFKVPGQHRTALRFELSGAPFISTSIRLLDEKHEELKSRKPRGMSSQTDTFSWNVDPGNYFIEVTRPPTSVMLVWDGSGSMEGRTQDLAAAIWGYLEQLISDEHVNLAKFSGPGVEVYFEDFTNDGREAWKVVQDKFQAKGGTPLYDAIEQGVELLKDRPGNRALILMTDGLDTTSRLDHVGLWSVVNGAGIRVYTVGLGAELEAYFPDRATTGRRLLGGIARATGGRSFVVQSSSALPNVYQAIGEEIRTETHYRLQIDTSNETGGLRVVADRDTLKTITAVPMIEFILDASGSMKQQIGNKSRIQIAKDVIEDIIERLPAGTEVAFRVYGSRIPGKSPGACEDSQLVAPLGPVDKSQLLQQIRKVEALGTTPIAFALRQLTNDLPHSGEEKLVILLTDGEERCGGDLRGTVSEMVEKGYNVRVDIVGFALANETLSHTLAEVAKITGGQFAEARDAATLHQAVGQTLMPSYRILDDNGRVLEEGKIEETISGLLPGVYSVIVETGNSEIRIDDVSVEPKKITILDLGDN